MTFQSTPPYAPPLDSGGASVSARVPGRRKRFSILTQRDKLTIGLMVGIPAFIHIFLIWLPTLGSIILSFTSWNGIGGLDRIRWIGLKNYENLVNIYQPFCRPSSTI